MKTNRLLVAAAAAGLMLGAAACSQSRSEGCQTCSDISTDIEKHACKGMNSCQGKGGCKTENNVCKGHNACKGQGGCKTI